MQNAQLPAGFVLEGAPQSTPQQSAQLPDGFVLEASPASSAKADMLPLPMTTGETATDVLKSLWAGAGNGIAGLLGLPADLYNLSNDQRIKQGNAHIEQMPPEQQQQIIAALKQNKSPLLRGADIDNVFQPQAPHQNIPGGSVDIQGKLNTVPGLDFQAQSTLGKLAQTGAEFATSTAAGGLPAFGKSALPKLTGAGFTSGVVSEGAGQLTEGTVAEIPARIAGGVVGGLPVFSAGVKKLAGNANARNLIRERLGDNITDADFDKAAAIQKTAKEQGIDLTGPESFDSPNLDKLDSATRQSPTGGSIISDTIGNRKQQVKRSLKQNFGDIAPDGLDPRRVGVQANEAASASLKATRKERSKATGPLFKAAEHDIAAPSLVQVLKDDIAKIKAPVGHPLNDAKNQFTKMLSGKGNSHVETNIGQLDETYKLWRDKLVIKHDSPPEQKALVARLGPMVKRLGQLIENESGNIRLGRQVHKRITQDIVKPLEQSGMTEIAKAKTLKTATRLLTNPELARPKQLSKLLNELGGQSPDLPAKMLRIHLENVFDRAGKALKTGQPNTGANFHKAVYNTDNARTTMATFFRSVEKQRGLRPGALFTGFDKTMKVLSRVGRISGGGSQTQPLQEIKREASKPGFVGKAAGAINILKGGPLAQIKEHNANIASEKTYRALAGIFTNPDSVSLIRQIAKSKEVMSPKMLTAINALLNTSRQSVNTASKSDSETR